MATDIRSLLSPLAFTLAVGLAAPQTASAELCPEVVPDDCLTSWQAHALEGMEITSNGSSGVLVELENTGEYPVCLGEQILYTSDLSQSFFLDDDITDAATEVGTGETYTTYYGNWTTDNGYYYPYLGVGPHGASSPPHVT